jgi:hypothetical protein
MEKLLEFSNPEEVRVAFDAGIVKLHQQIVVRMKGEKLETTVGRILLWEKIIPEDNLLYMQHIMTNEQEKAEKALRELKQGEPFKKVVEAYSESKDRKMTVSLDYCEKMSSNEYTPLKMMIWLMLYMPWTKVA